MCIVLACTWYQHWSRQTLSLHDGVYGLREYNGSFDYFSYAQYEYDEDVDGRCNY